MADNDVFSADRLESNPDEITLADLVGDDRKYKTPDEIAKAYVHAEDHIRALERDNAVLRARADIANRQPDPNPDPAQPESEDDPDPARHDPNGEKFRSRIREEVKALSNEERATQNAEAAAQKLVEVYGSIDKANDAVRQRAQELGVSTEWLRDTASRSPSAFFASMGVNPDVNKENRETPASRSEVVINRGDPKVKNFEYFDIIRKNDPKAYFSAAMQREMMNQARQQGDAFYRR